MRLSILALGLIFTFSLSAQFGSQTPSERVAGQTTFTSIDILDLKQDRSADQVPSDLVEYELFDLNIEELGLALEQRHQGLRMSIPTAHGALDLELVEVDLFAPGYMVTVMPSGTQHKMSSEERGIHYQGIVAGETTSVVAISIFNDEISGIIARPGIDGNQVIGKLENSSSHILYTDKDIRDAQDFICATDDSDFIAHEEVSQGARASFRCPEIYFDISKEIHDNKGGVTQAENYVTSLFNQVVALYSNDGIGMTMAGSTVWSSTEPFSDLTPYGNYRNSNPVAGDLAQYLNLTYGGGVAWLNGLCGSSKYSVSGVNASFSNIPTYSWSVEVMAHELGHNLGSPHTHACAWNGNNTAIDGCGPNAGYSEGCTGSNPAGGGTIMSYCHLTSVGINFSLGFGSQVATRISNYIDGSSCVVACGPAPTCDDGIQNGTETGVDCGGASCPACPFLCDDNPLYLTLVLDQYPQETSWSVLDASGATVASNGTSYSGMTGATVVENICLPDGCYDLVVNDSHGDGMCCGYGDGSYSLATETGTILASGGAFGTSETTSFCVEQNPGVGCVVSDSAPVDLTKSFDPVNGVEDRVQVKFFKDSPQVAYASVDSAACDILFWKKRTLDPVTGQVTGNPVQNPDSILLSKVQKTNNNPLFKWPVKYRADGANNAKRVDPNYRYEWKVRCYCEKGDGAVSDWSDTKTFNTPDFDPVTGVNGPAGIAGGSDVIKSISPSFLVEVYPNPADGMLNLSYKSNKSVTSTIQIFDMFGRLVRTEVMQGTGKMMNVTLDIADLKTGNYFLSITNETQSTTERFSVAR